MNWEALGALAEAFGAIAVVVSLLVLAKQVRESNRVARGETIRARGERMVDIWFRCVENPRLFDVVQTAFFDETEPEALSTEDRRAIHMVVRALVHLWESEYIENRDGELDDEVWARRARAIAGMVDTKPAYRAEWDSLGPLLTAGFVEEIEKLRQSAGTDSSPPVEPTSPAVEPTSLAG